MVNRYHAPVAPGRSVFTVVRLDPFDHTQIEEIATVAARAFHFDPFFAYLSPAHLLRARGLAIFWRAQAAAFAPAAEAHGARGPDGRLVGVALWIRPGAYPLPASAQLRQALGAARALIPRPRALIDGARYLLAIERVHPHEPLWYLALLVADPSMQRSGIGTALQQQILDRADQEALATYLETQNPDNIAYYRRFGYEIVHELKPVKAGPPLWTMRREPRQQD